jgi:hypothetical protein
LIVFTLFMSASLSLGQSTTTSVGGSNYGWFAKEESSCEPVCSQSNCLWCDPTYQLHNIHTWDPPYGVIANYHVATVTINSQLEDMFALGQRRLRLFLWFKRGAADTRTVLNSTGGNFSPQIRANLRNLLLKVREIGYAEVIIAYGALSWNLPYHNADIDVATGREGHSNHFLVHPEDPCRTVETSCFDPWRGSAEAWSFSGELHPALGFSNNEDFFQENWAVISNTYPLVTSSEFSPLLVKVDLGPEYQVPLTPDYVDTNGDNIQEPQYQQGYRGRVLYHLRWGKQAYYLRKLWINFNKSFGKQLTLGVSLAGLFSQAWSDNIRGTYQVYDGTNYGRPYLIGLSLYHAPIRSEGAGAQLQAIHDTLNELGDPTTGIVIVESNYDSAEEALSLKPVINAIKGGRPIFYLMQWPIDSSVRSCGGFTRKGCDVATPSRFANYIANGY